MKKSYVMLFVTIFLAAGNSLNAFLGDVFNTAGNVVKGTVNTATGVVRDVAEGDIVEMPGNTVKRAVNTTAGAVEDTGKTVANVFDGNENPVENKDFDYSDNEPIVSAETVQYNEADQDDIE